MLRESSTAKGESYDLNLLLGGGSGDGNIPHGALLTAFAEAVLGPDDRRLAEIISDIRARLGDAAPIGERYVRPSRRDLLDEIAQIALPFQEQGMDVVDNRDSGR